MQQHEGTCLPFPYIALSPCFIWVGWMSGTSPHTAHVHNVSPPGGFVYKPPGSGFGRVQRDTSMFSSKNIRHGIHRRFTTNMVHAKATVHAPSYIN